LPHFFGIEPFKTLSLVFSGSNLLVTSQKFWVGAIAIIWYHHMFFANTPHSTVVVRVWTEFLVVNYFWKKIVFNFCCYVCCYVLNKLTLWRSGSTRFRDPLSQCLLFRSWVICALTFFWDSNWEGLSYQYPL